MTLWIKTTDGIVPVGGAYMTVTPWTPVTTFSGSWAAYGTPGTYHQPAYRRVGDMVQLRGLIKSGTSGTTAFTLPAGFRPPLAAYAPMSAALSSPVVGLISILPNGNVNLYCSDTTALPLECQFSLTSDGQAPDYTQAPNGLWTEYTPNVYQSVGVTVSPSYARYVKIGQTVIGHVSLVLTSTGTAGQAIRFSVPYPMLANTTIVGEGRLVDASGPYTIYPATLERSDANTVVLSSSTGSGVNAWFLGTAGTPFTGAVANGDVIQGMFVYEAAS